MSRPAETDPNWLPVRIDTTVPYCFVRMKQEKKYKWSEIIRIGLDQLTKPSEVNERISMLEARNLALMRKLEQKGIRILP